MTPKSARRKKFKPVAEFTNIRTLPSGYQVTITRSKVEFSRHFAGHSEQSLAKAARFRDQVLRELPTKRVNPVPRYVLKALGVPAEVVGVSRHSTRPFYQVPYRDRGKMRTRSFYWHGGKKAEAEAYAAAVAFRAEFVSRSLSSSSR